MAEEMTQEQTAEALDNAYSGNPEQQPTQAQEPEQDASKEQAPVSAGLDESKLQQMLEQMLSQKLNPIQSQLGKFRQIQSEFDKLKQGNISQAPKSWSDLDPQAQTQTKELLKHVFDELYGDKFKAFEDYRVQAEEAQQRDNAATFADSLLRQAAGDKYADVMPHATKIFSAAQEAARMGDESAQEFISELYATKSGAHRLVSMAMAEYSKSLEAQNEKVKANQSAKAQKASTGVNSSRPPQAGVGKDGLPTDKSERLAALAKQLDEVYDARG